MDNKLKQIFDAHKKTHWLHEYAEDGIVNFNDLQKIVKEFNSIPIEKLVSPIFAEEIENIVLQLGKIQLNLMSILKPDDHNNVSDFIHQAREYLINIKQ